MMKHKGYHSIKVVCIKSLETLSSEAGDEEIITQGFTSLWYARAFILVCLGRGPHVLAKIFVDEILEIILKAEFRRGTIEYLGSTEPYILGILIESIRRRIL